MSNLIKIYIQNLIEIWNLIQKEYIDNLLPWFVIIVNYVYGI